MLKRYSFFLTKIIILGIIIKVIIGEKMENDVLKISDKVFHSRLFVGTGKFSSYKIMKEALKVSGTEMVTMALRRVNLNKEEDDLLSYLDKKSYTFLPNTSGARNANEAIKIAYIAREAGISDWVKLEITPDPYYLLPDGEETLKAATILAKDGFKVLPYVNADPILCKKLEDVGCVTVMPLGAPIGTNKGLKTIDMLKIIISQARVPVIIDAGIGAPSHASYAMEIGASAVLVNTAIATARDPVRMAYAFKIAVESGRIAYLAGLAKEKEKAEASSPLEWIDQLR